MYFTALWKWTPIGYLSIIKICGTNWTVVKKGRGMPIQAWTGSWGTWKWQDCQPYVPAAFIPEEIPLVLISVKSRPHGHSATWRIKSIKNLNDPTGNRTRDLPAFSTVPQPNAPSLPARNVRIQLYLNKHLLFQYYSYKKDKSEKAGKLKKTVLFRISESIGQKSIFPLFSGTSLLKRIIFMDLSVQLAYCVQFP
jgi:hypothetical protein